MHAIFENDVPDKWKRKFLFAGLIETKQEKESLGLGLEKASV